MHYVYEIYDLYGSIVKVGQTARPTVRGAEHIQRGEYRSHAYQVVESFSTKQEALDREEALQLEYGLVTDRQKCSRGGIQTAANGNSTGGSKFQKCKGASGGYAAASKTKECPNCGKIGKMPSIFKHIKNCI